jgi:serralysin
MSTAFRIVLTGSSEVPPNASTASGLGTVIFDSVAVTASYEINAQGMDFSTIWGLPDQSGNSVTGVFVHAAATGANGPIAFGPANDLEFTASALSDGSTTFKGRWDASDTGTSINTYASALGSATQGASVGLYWNIHTVPYPGGEVRGQWVCIATDSSEAVDGTRQSDILPGLGGDDVVKGYKGNDRITGDAGDDMLSGGRGDDRIAGGDGKDSLRGDSGGDLLTGGAGKDKFLFFAITDSTAAAPDQISEFSAGERIDLHRIDADVTTGGDQAFHFVSAFTGAAGEAVLSYLAGPDVTKLEVDVNGDGVGEMPVLIDGHLTAFSGWVL